MGLMDRDYYREKPSTGRNFRSFFRENKVTIILILILLVLIISLYI